MHNKNNIKETIIKDTTRYNFVQYGSQVLGFFSAMAMRKFLGPYYIGMWSLLQIIVGYAGFTALSTDTAAAFKIPFFKGKGDQKSIGEVTNTTFTIVFWTALLSGLGVFITTLFCWNKHPIEVVVGLVVVSLYIILRRLYSYYLVLLRANSNFPVINRSVIFDAVVNLALIFLLVGNFKIYGLYVAIILMSLFNTLYIHALAKYKIIMSFNFKRAISLIKYGLPLLLLGVLGMVLQSIDRIMIAKMLGITFVGYYSIGIMAKNYLGGLSNNFGIVTIPRMMEAYGKEEKSEHLRKFVTVSAETISFLLPSLLGFIFLVAPLFIIKILPKFIPGILTAQILLLDIFFRSCCPQAEQFLIALNKQIRIVPITIFIILLNIALNYIFIKHGWGIYGVALATSIASFLYFLITFIYAMKHFTSFKKIALFILKIMSPLCLVSTIVVTSYNYISLPNLYLQLAVNLTILALVSAPLFYYIDKKTRIIRIIFGALTKR